MPRLRIAFLSRWYWDENRRSGTSAGGPVQQVAEAVAALGHEVIVLSQKPDLSELTEARIGALEVWLSPREKRRDFFTGLRDKWAKQFYRHRKVHTDALVLGDFLRRRGPFDILWAGCEEPDGLVAAVAARRGIKLPPLLTQVMALRYHFEAGAAVFDEKPALRLAFRQSGRIVVNSELVATAISAYARGRLPLAELRRKTRVYELNLQREFFEQAEGVTGEAEPNRVLFLGALNEKKGALVFVEAARQLKASGSPAVFAVLGGFTEKNRRFESAWEEALARFRAACPLGALELLGKLPAPEVRREIRRAAVVVLPSLFDEFSRALVEALVLSRPVVTTSKVGAWPLVTENACGAVVEPNDPAALAGAIEAALRPDAPYAANARRLAPKLAAEVSPEALARKLAAEFAELTGGLNP